MLCLSVWAVCLMKRVLIFLGKIMYVLALFMLGTMLVQPSNVALVSAQWKLVFEYICEVIEWVILLIRSYLENCPIFFAFIVL